MDEDFLLLLLNIVALIFNVKKLVGLIIIVGAIFAAMALLASIRLLNAKRAAFAVWHLLRPDTASSRAIVLKVFVFEFNHKVVVGFLGIFLFLVHITIQTYLVRK